MPGLRGRPEGALVNWSRVEMLIPHGGIRVEDNIAITKDGSRNLTRPAFAALEGETA